MTFFYFKNGEVQAGVRTAMETQVKVDKNTQQVR